MGRRLTRSGVALLVAATACAVVAFLERHITSSNLPNFGITGAYFNRNVGAPAYSGPFPTPNWFDPVKPLNPYLWAGLAVGLLIGGIVLLLSARAIKRSTAASD